MSKRLSTRALGLAGAALAASVMTAGPAMAQEVGVSAETAFVFNTFAFLVLSLIHI